MRKNIVALCMIGVMAFSGSSFVMAEESTFDLDEILDELEDVEVTEREISGLDLRWENYEDRLETDERLADGSFWEDSYLGLMYFLPGSMEQIDLDDESIEAGFHAFFLNENGEEMNIQIIENEDVTDIYTYEEMKRDGGMETTFADVNDLRGILYYNDEQMEDPDKESAIALAFVAPNGGTIVEFNFAPADQDDPYMEIIPVIISSIQQMEM